MDTPLPNPAAPGAVEPDRTTRLMAAVDRLAEIGMELAEALRRQVLEPGAPRVFMGDPTLAFTRIARAVRLTVLLAQRLDDGLPDLPELNDADARAEADAAAVEAEPAERLNERETEGPGGERGEREADESVWLKRPISALAAQICRDLDQPYDAALWDDDIPVPYPNAARPHADGDPGVPSPGARPSEKGLVPRFRGDERGLVRAGEYRPP